MQDANLWDVSSGGPTIVFTQSGARSDFQARLRDRGVEVIEFPFLTPERVAQYCYDRGFLQVEVPLRRPCARSGAFHRFADICMTLFARSVASGMLRRSSFVYHCQV